MTPFPAQKRIQRRNPAAPFTDRKEEIIMTTAKININTIDDVKNFVSIVTRCDYDVDIISGRYAIDAKSIMGIFSLDLSKELTLNIHSDNCSDFLDEIDKYIVK